MITSLQKTINKYGRIIVTCNKHCEGIENNRRAGILPRGLILKSGQKNGLSCVVVGINPGNMNNKERLLYKNKPYYNTTVEFIKLRGNRIAYIKKLQRLLNYLGFRGQILWTELVKCQNKKKGKLPPLDTFRTCVKNYLDNEIRAVPRKWPLVAVGRQTYEALAFLYPDKAVIGVIHPTGPFAQQKFDRLLKKNKLRNYGRKVNKSTIWLNDI